MRYLVRVRSESEGLDIVRIEDAEEPGEAIRTVLTGMILAEEPREPITVTVEQVAAT